MHLFFFHENIDFVPKFIGHTDHYTNAAIRLVITILDKPYKRPETDCLPNESLLLSKS